MTQQGQIGGARDIMAQRVAATNMAGSIDTMRAELTSFETAFGEYTAQDFQDMGNSADAAAQLAYFMALIPNILASEAIDQLTSIAAACRDITRL
jgi:hypothetical protein